MYGELRPYRQAARVRDPATRVDAVADELADVEQELRATIARVHALANEPSVRALPHGGLDSERDRWAADRHTRQQAAARARRQRQHEATRRIEPPPPSPSTPDAGWAIGR